jgi:ribosomal protein L37AE/L43A
MEKVTQGLNNTKHKIREMRSMKQEQRCSQCGNHFFTNMIKVFVLKKRYCPDCKEALKISPDGKIYKCLKCQKEFHKEIGEEYGRLGISIDGSTRSFEAAQKSVATGFIEAERVYVPEEQMCQKCRNMEHRYADAARTREQKIARGEGQVRAYPKDVTDAQVYRYEVYKKTQEDLRAKIQGEEQEKQRKAQEAAAKAKLVTEMANKLAEGEKKEQ